MSEAHPTAVRVNYGSAALMIDLATSGIVTRPSAHDTNRSAMPVPAHPPHVDKETEMRVGTQSEKVALHS